MLATLALSSVALFIVILATWLVASARTLDTAVQGLVDDGRRARYVEQVETEVLRYQRSSNSALSTEEDSERLRAEATKSIDELLWKATRLSGSPAERAEVSELGRRIHAFLDTRRALEAQGASLSTLVEQTRAPLNAALDQMDRMQQHYLERLRESEQRTAEVAREATLQGVTVIVLVMLTVVLAMVVFRTQVVGPLNRLRGAILEFRASGKGTEAELTGPLEIREITRTLNETTSALAEDRKRQLAFVAGVAHDLRSPLTALTLAVSLLEESGCERKNGATRELACRQIAGNASRLTRMVDDLMDVTRSEAGELAVTLHEIDLREPVRTVVELYYQQVRSHRIVLEEPDVPLMVNADASRIEQAVVNLVSNAIKYSPEGRVVRITLSRGASEAVLSVSDQGVGIPDDELAVIFEPFHRGAVSRDVAPGAGLGLAILARIVRAHEGRLEVDSKLGEGSTFRLILPLATSTPKAAVC